MTFEEWAAQRVMGSMEREFARDAWNAARHECIRLVMNERVDAGDTGTDEDEAYNTALVHATETILELT